LDNSNPLKRAKYLLLLFGLVVGVFFDILFYNKTLGISYPIFIVVLFLIFFISVQSSKIHVNRRAWILAVPILVLSTTFCLYSNTVLKVLNYLIIPVLVIVLSILVSGINRANWTDFRFIADIIKRVFVPFGSIHKPFITFFGMVGLDTKDNKKTVALKILTGVVISIPILIVVILLLSSADIVFKNLFVNIPLVKIIKHAAAILAVSIYSFSFVFSIFKTREQNKNNMYGRIKWKLFLDPIVLLTILSLLNIVYITFTVIQFAYLFGGNSFMLPSSFTYAEYARRGFFELIVVTIINFGILLFSITFVKKESRKANAVINAFLSAIAVFTFVLLVSAFYRMVLYEMAYGCTYLRIFVQAFMILLFVLFIINLAYIWYRRLPIIKSYILCTLIIYIILNFANVDVIIARNNINRYCSTGEIDVGYLTRLSYDAIPEMTRLLKSEDKEIVNAVNDYFEKENKILSEQDQWQGYNFSKIKAQKVLDKYCCIQGEHL
jgi:hypothetical protein